MPPSDRLIGHGRPLHVSSDGVAAPIRGLAALRARELVLLEVYARRSGMSTIHLQGRLVCQNEQEVAHVRTHLPRHVELTLAEAGCISCAVISTEEPLVWRVGEIFQDAAAFRKHQDRVRDSEWGRPTASIERDYDINGL